MGPRPHWEKQPALLTRTLTWRPAVTTPVLSLFTYFSTSPWTGQVSGYYADTIPFIKQRDIAFLGHDFNIDWAPRPGWGQAEGIPNNPIHVAVLNWMGVNIVECLDLERAVETARRLKRYEFLMTFAPLPVEGGTGSPLNPLAIF